MHILKEGTLFILIFLAALEDLRTYKVNNNLIALGFLLGLFFNISSMGAYGVVLWFLGGITPIILLFLLYLFRMIGASDLKVFSIVGCFYGISFVIQSIIISFIIGAVISFLVLIQNRNIYSRFFYLFSYLVDSIKNQKICPYYISSIDGTKNVIPFIVAIMGGVIYTFAF
ncbi:prepilin peptidase [Anaeromicropila herbilytica]|uniref:Prepilin type IV endopeptidase peptidase domain-containing protein n=1 Tax=Anaeromicropila herbilytica TaxID=2785025 RepID=A0A7R7EQ01_9FIRM|nr:prepilin peptidase [Anaeromicropila herbilytica]BCN32940.1 hypothetical protein bsdtb5_42350 [Anaeromicropila herbilytica]